MASLRARGGGTGGIAKPSSLELQGSVNAVFQSTMVDGTRQTLDPMSARLWGHLVEFLEHLSCGGPDTIEDCGTPEADA